jgi:hypothetical protein
MSHKAECGGPKPGWIGLGGILEHCVDCNSPLLAHICGAVHDSAPQPLVRALL